ncbi:hypothetical protein GOHSU_23_00370 [Gordonia hirsuta DSM 44140 = NBRC 16056]|uniref:Uncharacterized protein n=1 Tax=Gordonia hirsuta DSM 44140 = NBRC 16056 TaxID=1121927 RepID=L7LAA6_9ACTN|nr:hypothetical protein [Gordonia hirsuta]GAC57691.1 hypothetical protein GOHSU_23_00370 [Gordonia hirsuta DSM 44140 = NBRC 16056]
MTAADSRTAPPRRGPDALRDDAGLRPDFRGRLLTGTDWFEHSYAGERVALLATGAEAAEILPEVLTSAAAVTVFEERPTWVAPVGVPPGCAGGRRHGVPRRHPHHRCDVEIRRSPGA